MIKDEYSPYKIIHHADKLSDLRAGVQIAPLQLHFVITNKCNHNCVFCAYRMKDYSSNELFDGTSVMDYKKITECLGCCSDMGVKAIQYTGGGEPTTHPNFFSILKNTFDMGMDVSLVSNGSLLNDDMCHLLGDSKWVRISMDAASESLYSLLRNVPKKTFGVVLSNIAKLVKYRKESVIGVGFVVEKENYKEILDAAKLAKSLGVDNFRISAAFTTMGFDYFNGFLSEAKELAKEATKLSDDKFTVFNLFGNRVSDTFNDCQNYSYCAAKELITYIGADYNVYTCCTLAYNKKGLIGSIRDMTLTELWESEAKKIMFDKHDPRIRCKLPCMYKSKNDFINYCINKNAKHINFI